MISRLVKRFFFSLVLWSFPYVCLALGDYQGPIDPGLKSNINDRATQLSGTAGLSPVYTVSDVVSTVINAFLSFLGIIFIILIITAGYNWMSARGDEQKVEKAKDTIQRAIIGLVIIVVAYAITYFVFQRLPGGTGPGGSGMGS
jgi:cytochrome bd-type quinol oxidase subunit 2